LSVTSTGKNGALVNRDNRDLQGHAMKIYTGDEALYMRIAIFPKMLLDILTASLSIIY